MPRTIPQFKCLRPWLGVMKEMLTDGFTTAPHSLAGDLSHEPSASSSTVTQDWSSEPWWFCTLENEEYFGWPWLRPLWPWTAHSNLDSSVLQFFIFLRGKTKPKSIKTNSQSTPLSFLKEKNNTVSLCIFLTPEFLKVTFQMSQDRS